MPTSVIMPALGMSQDTGRVLRWLVPEGHAVVQGQPLMEIETDKVTTEIDAPASGVLAGVRAQPGQEVPVGQVIAFVLAPGETLPPSAEPPAHLAGTGSAALGRPAVAPPPVPSVRGLAASPKARRLAQELGVDLAAVTGTGTGGEITAADVASAGELHAPAEGRAGVSGVWRVMAERLTRSWTTAPHFYLSREVVAQTLVDRRRLWLSRIPSITYTDVILAVVAKTLRQHPQLNAHWEAGAIVPAGHIDIGLAVATDAGLLVPVVRRADEASLEEIARQRFDLVTRAHAGRLRPDDVVGGTFTISNLGMHGVDTFAPILNPPQAAILGVGRIADRVVAVSGAPAVRSMMTVTLACDHRVVDGARAARFLDALAQALEAQEEMAP